MNSSDEIYQILPIKIKQIFIKYKVDAKHLQEIRMRIGQPILVRYKNKEYFLSTQIGLTRQEHFLHILSKEEMRQVLEYISNYSLYAYEEQIKQGFITIRGGHRIGIAGQTVVVNKEITSIKHITCLNIRVAHEVLGCANKIFRVCRKENKVLSTLIIAPPGAGKTTLLRDFIRLISMNGQTVCVVDERSEIGASHMGIVQNQLGIRTDILDGCPKDVGIMMAIRSMAPDVLAVDEIGSKEDVKAIEHGINSGCTLIATIHGKNLKQIQEKMELKRLLEFHVFQRFIILGSQQEVGKIEQMVDGEGKRINDENNRFHISNDDS